MWIPGTCLLHPSRRAPRHANAACPVEPSGSRRGRPLMADRPTTRVRPGHGKGSALMAPQSRPPRRHGGEESDSGPGTWPGRAWHLIGHQPRLPPTRLLMAAWREPGRVPVPVTDFTTRGGHRRTSRGPTVPCSGPGSVDCMMRVLRWRSKSSPDNKGLILWTCSHHAPPAPHLSILEVAS